MKIEIDNKFTKGTAWLNVEKKCNCPCHEEGRVVMHFMACCSGLPSYVDGSNVGLVKHNILLISQDIIKKDPIFSKVLSEFIFNNQDSIITEYNKALTTS